MLTAFTSYIDLAQVVLYLFWFFFAGVILYLLRENKREGYPLESDRSERTGRVKIQGFPAIPPPKTYRLANGRTVSLPSAGKERELKARPVAPWPGAPLEPTGDPMADGVGPAAYALRTDEPDHTADGKPAIVPLRIAEGITIAKEDPDPRGMDVVTGDGKVAGRVSDVWVDRAEMLIRYLEVEASGGRKVVVPMTLSKVDGGRRRVSVVSVYASQLAAAPAPRSPEQITRAEEDRITAYFASGHLYASPDRAEPFV